MVGIQESLFPTTEGPVRPPRVVLNLGGGVDSSAMVARFLLEPEVRDFDLEDLTVLTAVVGRSDEYQSTQDALNAAVFPLLAARAVRTVQVARIGAAAGEGYAVLEDTRRPTRLLREETTWSLYEHQLRRGIVPLVSPNKRDCSQKAKHYALERFCRDDIGPHPYRQMLGFDATETKRIATDIKHATEFRRPEHPLATPGMGSPTVQGLPARGLRDRRFPALRVLLLPLRLQRQ